LRTPPALPENPILFVDSSTETCAFVELRETKKFTTRMAAWRH
jgi:hypothetical protein